jgi:hypothetical protein
MGGRFEGSNLHHRRSTFRHLDNFAAAILLTGRRLIELGLKANPRQPMLCLKKQPNYSIQHLSFPTILVSNLN